MRDQDRAYIRATIHRILDDSAQPFIPRIALCVSGARFNPEITELLKQWENDGYLKVLCDPDSVEDDGNIVEMLSYIKQRSSIPGFLNWEGSK